MSFLTPLFLAGLAAIAIPVIVHLIQKERKNVVAFPSLMFVRRIPYQSVNRRKIRNWPLLLLRIAALALIVAAFARPFFRGEAFSAAAAGGAREVVLLVDRSYSLAYGDRWNRATAAASGVIDTLNAADRASVVLFDTGAEVALRSTSDKGRLKAAVESARPGAAATKYGPALKLAGSILTESGLPNREVVIVSDFQRGGWSGGDGVRLPDGSKVTTLPVRDDEIANVSVMPAALQRTTFSGQERVTVTAGALNRGGSPATVTLTLEVDGRAIQSRSLSLEPHASATTTFDGFTPTARFTRGTVRIGDDRLAPDNAYHFVVSPRQRVKVMVVERPGTAAAASLYLAQALSLGENPSFEVVRRSMEAVTAEDISSAAVIVLNDVPASQLLAERLSAFVERGGGLFAAFGERATWPSAVADVMPMVVAGTADRTRGTPGRVGTVDYGHPVFEAFRAPRSGDFSVARFYNYRTGTPEAGAQVLARFDDGAPALLERRKGAGRVMVWTSTLDVTWNDLALKPVFLPFIHRVAGTLASYQRRPEAMTVGDVLPVAPRRGDGQDAANAVVLAPSGRRVPLEDKALVIELREQGFYEVRAHEKDPEPITVAANVDLAEADMTGIDPAELAAGATGRAGDTAGAASNATLSNEERERTQRLWWFLLFAGLLLLGAETVLANSLKTRYVR